ncbi:MAG: 6-hydroxymethylpterin diphosphokinase MptE-like protein [Haloarculaceae archaeon]
MDFDTWEPVYEAILDDFGFDRGSDERARNLLADIVADADPRSPAALDFTGQRVAIAGAGPSLTDDLDGARRADAVVAASDAATVCRERGVAVDCMVTDLDERGDIARTLTAEGTPVAVHAHGDNQVALRERVPALTLDAVVPTTQAEPVGPVVNTGGFTDGDRSAFLADHCGAAELVFVGWDLDDPDVGTTKRRKFAWAERLLRWLERRRGERFGVLDGRRDAIDESPLPD